MASQKRRIRGHLLEGPAVIVVFLSRRGGGGGGFFPEQLDAVQLHARGGRIKRTLRASTSTKTSTTTPAVAVAVRRWRDADDAVQGEVLRREHEDCVALLALQQHKARAEHADPREKKTHHLFFESAAAFPMFVRACLGKTIVFM